MNSLVLRSAVVAALGGLLFGFDTAVISGTTEDLERVYDISGFTLGLAVAVASASVWRRWWPRSTPPRSRRRG